MIIVNLCIGLMVPPRFQTDGLVCTMETVKRSRDINIIVRDVTRQQNNRSKKEITWQQYHPDVTAASELVMCFQITYYRTEYCFDIDINIV